MIMLIDDQLRPHRRCADETRASGRHDHRLHERPRRDAGRPRPDPQGLSLFRGSRPRAADYVLAGPLSGRACASDALVETIDVAPTLLAAAGLRRAGGDAGTLARCRSSRAAPDPHTHQGARRSANTSTRWVAIADHTHGSMVCDGRYKSVVYHGHAIGELSDLECDPGGIRQSVGRARRSANSSSSASSTTWTR